MPYLFYSFLTILEQNFFTETVKGLIHV